MSNLFGALLTYFYFRFVDYTAAQLPSQVSSGEIVFFVVGFTILGLVGYVWGRRWTGPLAAGGDAPPREVAVRRRAILVPFAFAGLTLVAWVFAGLIWGLLFPLLAGTFSWPRSLRMVFGITCIAGTVATAFMFFASEHLWRRMLPAFFPEGDLAAVGGVLRLQVRTRLLVIFLMISTVPLAILGVLAYTRAAALLQVDQATASEIVSNMLLFIAFIVAVGILAAVGLSVFVANSVAAPLRDLQHAMRQVEQGNLEVRSPVVSNDEIGAAAEGFNRMVHGLRERELLRETFGKYVSPEVRDEILAGRVSLDGQVQELTILFADLRDFTPWVEATPPREVVRDLNAYFTEMDAAIRGHGGLVLQFIGDEIEAVFGAPVPRPDHAAMAARAALEMRARLAHWNGERRRAGKAELHHGIGIHTGRVLAGNIGSSERLAYALVGDAVNLASRIQDLTKQLGADILVSGTTRRLLDGGFALEPLPAVRVKGKSDEVEVYRLA
ncbi:MAG: HAMP domain-containing protein [Candidatus Rokubacteria bacterium]|nr:HAMP domain-containing protein [Candidatus Rokubacteria bacterium]